MTTSELIWNGSADDTTSPRVTLLGTRVSATTFDRAAQILDAMVRRARPAYVSCANVYSLMLGRDDPRYQSLLNEAAYVTADGMPVVWALRALGHDAERVHNDDLFFHCCSRYPGWRHFFVGGRTGQPEQVASYVLRRFPGIEIAGTYATPVRPVPEAETEAIVAAIRESRATIVWVGMGTPAQDDWMSVAAPRAGIPMVGIGSMFDLAAGRTRPAPEWMKRAGLQWLFRLALEPRRLGRRYLLYNPRFVVAMFGELIRRQR